MKYLCIPAVLLFCAAASAQSPIADAKSSALSGRWILVEKFADDTPTDSASPTTRSRGREVADTAIGSSMGVPVPRDATEPSGMEPRP